MSYRVMGVVVAVLGVFVIALAPKTAELNARWWTGWRHGAVRSATLWGQRGTGLLCLYIALVFVVYG
jgi:hypothetical protein